jgi:hypothetical protein
LSTAVIEVLDVKIFWKGLYNEVNG